MQNNPCQLLCRCARGCVFLALWILFSSSSNADTLYFDFNINLTGDNDGFLYLFGESDQTVTVQNNAGYHQTITLNNDGFFNLLIPRATQQVGTGVRETGFKISSDGPLAGYFINRQPFSTDMTFLIEEQLLGSDYIIASQGAGFSEFPDGSQVAIHAIQDGTSITFEPIGASPIEIVLNAGQTYKYAASNTNLTGSTVQSNFPIAVFAGHACANVPDSSVEFCDTLLEQMISTDLLSTRYYLSASRGASISPENSDLIRVVAANDATAITINGNPVTTLNRGEFYEFDLNANAGAVVEATAPVLMAQYLKGGSSKNTDPAFAIIPGIESWLTEYRSSTPDGTQSFVVNYASIAIKTTDLNTLKLDNVPVDISEFTPISGSDYSRGIIDLPLGIFTLKASSPFLLMLGGGSNADSYLTIGGAQFAAGITPYLLGIKPPAELTLDDESITTGQFNLTRLIGYSDTHPQGVELLDEAVVHHANIGTETFHELLNIPNDIEVLNAIGFFEATSPAKPPVHFDHTLGPIGRTGPQANTITLPLATDAFFYQITNLNSGKNVFVDGLDSKPIVSSTPLAQTLETFEDNNSTWYIGYRDPIRLRIPSAFQEHGTFATPITINTPPVNTSTQAPNVTDTSVTVTQGDSVDLTFTVSNPTEETLKWSLVEIIGTGVNLNPNFDPSTQRLTWDTSGSEKGTFQIRVEARDASNQGSIGTLTVNLEAIAPPILCDIDHSGIVDQSDINLIFVARNQFVEIGDPRDYDQNGLITVLDARQCTTRCTNENCSS